MFLPVRSTQAQPLHLLLAALLLGSSACGSCAGDPVPFGLDASAHGDDPDAPPTEARRAPPQVLPANTQRVAIEGATLDVANLNANGGALRAVWPMDVDGDGDLDTLLLWTRDRSAQLSFARRQGDSFEAPIALGLELSVPEPAPKAADPAALPSAEPPVPELCTLEAPQFAELGPLRASARFSLSCGADTASRLAIVDLGRTPRGSLSLTASGGLTMQAEPQLADADEDGHDDLTVALTLGGGGLPQSTISLRWFDRPAGLARDAEEPEAALITAAEAAEARLASDPAGAGTAAAAVLGLERALCTASPGPHLRVGGTPLPCGPSAGAGLALVVRIAALARQGKLAEASLLEREVSDARYRLGPKGRRTLASAFRAPAAPASLRRRVVGEVAGADGAASVLTTLGFLPDGRLAVRAGMARVYDLGVDPPMATPLVDDAPPVRSPDGRLAVRDIHHSCRGYVASVLAASLAHPGPAVMPGQDVLLQTAPPPEGVSCDPLPQSMLDDNGGFEALGWAPQGLVIAHAGSLMLVPLTATGQAAGDPMPLPDDAPLPAPLNGATISANGSRWVEPSPHGVILHQRGSAPAERLLPRGADDEPAPRAVAISPDGRRIAYLAGAHLVVLEGF